MYAQLLIAASFALASYEDVKERLVNDLYWIPAGVGVAYVVYSYFLGATTLGFEFYLVKVVLLGGIALAFTYFGLVGQADGIAIAFVAADPYALSPIVPLFAAAVVALFHILYEYLSGNAGGGKVIPMEQFLREQRWIPKAVVSDGVRKEVSRDVNVAREEVEAAGKPGATVEVRYGVPTVAYLGVGYVAYLFYLVAFNYPAFAGLP